MDFVSVFSGVPVLLSAVLAHCQQAKTAKPALSASARSLENFTFLKSFCSFHTA